MSVALVREVGAAAAAAGVLTLLVPVPGLPPTARRVIGLLLIVGAWLTLALSLAPGSVTDRLGSPVGIGVGVVAIAIGGVVAYGAGRLVLARPTAWFALLGLCLPLRIPVPIGGDQRNLLLPLYLVIIAGVAAWVVARLLGRAGVADDPRTPLDIPLAVFFAFAAASTLWSADAKEATVKLVFFYIPFALLFVAVVAWWPRARALAALAASTVVLATGIAALAVVQYETRWIFWNDRLETANFYSHFFRANGIFFDPNILGRYLVVAIVAVVAFAWLRPRATTFLAAAPVIVVLCAGLAVSFSRSSCLMLMVGMAMLAARAFGVRRTATVGVVVAVALGGAAVVASSTIRGVLTDSSKLENVSEGRFDLIRGGLEIWRTAPLEGAGLGGFEKKFSESLTPTEQRKIRVVISHNTPVTELSELGLIGFALFLALVVATGRTIRQGSRRVTANDGWAAWVMLAIVAGIFVHATLYAALFEDPFTWVLTAGALALCAARRPLVGGAVA
jgi:putative inorganic carbon (hco3(-)) transporter